jgi:hypothetical protein
MSSIARAGSLTTRPRIRDPSRRDLTDNISIIGSFSSACLLSIAIRDRRGNDGITNSRTRKKEEKARKREREREREREKEREKKTASEYGIVPSGSELSLRCARISFISVWQTQPFPNRQKIAEHAIPINLASAEGAAARDSARAMLARFMSAERALRLVFHRHAPEYKTSL